MTDEKQGTEGKQESDDATPPETGSEAAQPETSAKAPDAKAPDAKAKDAKTPDAKAKHGKGSAKDAQKAPEPPPLQRAPLRGEVTRRGFLSVLTLGWGAFTVASVGLVGAMVRYLFPNVLYEPPQEFKIGFPGEFGVDQVDERFKAEYGVWIVRESTGFYALSTVCTHLGCTPNWLASDEKFKCPCHGSGFIKSGVNVEGPAPRPLERYRITLAEDGQILVDKNQKFQEEKGQWTMDGAYLFYTA